MGQAKLRGTREERVAEGVRKRKIAEAERQLRREKRWASMSKQDREMAVFLLAFGVAHG